MTDQEKSQFLEQLLADDELNRLRQICLSHGLQEMRGKRRRALTARFSMLALPALMLAAIVLCPRFQKSHRMPERPTSMAFSPKAESKVEYITTEQLFALFPNRPMALVGKPGHQQLIFLDDPQPSANQ